MARSDVTAQKQAITPHPAYILWQPIWQQLLDVYEGGGGFIDTSRPYLYAHPREWLDHSYVDDKGRTVANPTPSVASPKLKSRRKIARYENIAATLIEQLKSALFRKPATRTFEDPTKIPDQHPLAEFWENADGMGRPLEALMPDYWTGAAVFGHLPLMLDRVGQTTDLDTAADTPPVVLRAYTPLDMVDWITDELGGLVSVRLLEAAPRTDFTQQASAVVTQVRTVTAEGWTLATVDKAFKPSAKIPETTGDHGFKALPVVMLYARRRAMLPTIGRSVLGDPALYIDLYNLTSEVRELLRNQTFAILNVPLGVDGSIEKETTLLGQTSGTQNVIFSSQPIDYVSPDGTNVQVYHEHIDRLVRLIYRLAVVGWEGDSKQTESGDSRKLKKEDLHQMLAGYAAECQNAEIQMAKLVYRANFGDNWYAQWEADKPSISYPDTFDVTDLLTELETVTQGIALELGETATKEMKKAVARKLLPNLPQPTQAQVDKEIAEAKVLTAQEQQQQLIEARFGATNQPPTGAPGDGGQPPPA